MGLFPSLIPSRSRAPSPTDDYWYLPWGAAKSTDAGVSVDEATALKYLTVFSCVSLIAGDVARLPLNLYRRRKDAGKDLVSDHKLYDLLHNRPNQETTSFNWRETAQAHLLLWGNHYSYCERDKTGAVIALWQLPNPGQVKPKRVGSEIVYEYHVDGETRIRRRDEIFHVPGFGFNGLIGLSMIGLAREAIGMGLAAEKFGSRFFGSGTHPSGLLTMPPESQAMEPDEQKKYLAFINEQVTGLGKSHNMMLLPNGEKYQTLTMPLDDAQFLDTRDHQKIEICGMYHVPPHKIALHGQNSNYNNLEQENSSYVDSCLMHWLVRWESAISAQLLSEKERRSGLFFEFLVEGLLRGDSQARADFYNKIFQIGAITPNQIRAKENMNPIEGGDQAFVMLNMVPLDQAGEIDMAGGANDQDEPAEPEEDETDIRALKNFFRHKNGEVEKRSIMARDRIARRYSPLIMDAATAVVNRETKAIKSKVASSRATKRDADIDGMQSFLADFYEKFPEYINKKMSPVLRSYMLAIADEAVSEIGGDDVNIDAQVKEYLDRYTERHVQSSLGQMIALLESKDTDEIDQRADEWTEKRPEKITTDETVRASGAAFSFVVFGAGLSTVLRNRGPSTCPYCRSLEGKKVTQQKPLISAGEEIDPEGADGPMKIYNTKYHPPIHQGCDCYVVAGM